MTNRRSHLILVGLILAALAGVVALGVPGSPIHKKVTLGLDLQGGLEVVLEAKPTKGQKLDSSALDRSVSIMRQRVDKLGVAEPEIRKQGSNQIVIELAGVHDPAKAASIIGKTAQLELYDLETSVTGPSLTPSGNPQETTSLYGLLSASQSLAKSGQPEGYYAFGKNKVKSVGPANTRAAALRQAKQASLKPPFTVLALPHDTVVVTCDSTEVVCPGNLPQQGNAIPPPAKGSYYYLFIHNPDLKKVDDVKGVPELTGSDLKLSRTRQDVDPTTNQPVVLMQFTGSGSHKFQQVTSEEYNRGHNRNGLPQHFAIVLDREIRSFPQIDPTKSDLAGGISGNAEISGIGSIGEAKDLALVLQTGALPVNFVQIERTDVSATLGKDSLNEAKKAALIGLLLVAVFLLLLYRFLGLVAVIGLGIYAAFLYAAILLFHVTLTLPGFAGLILTIGVAADANVVVFERIKEEVRAGKSVRAAIAAGYAKGFHTIIDANVVTVITALVLFAVATAGVKGFALMLMIGTVISLVTAVAATRAMLGLLSGFAWFDNPRFMGAAGQQSAKWLQIDFMRRRYLWFAISGVIIVIGAASLGDARGHRLAVTDRALHRDQVRPQVRRARDRGAAARHRDPRRRLFADRARVSNSTVAAVLTVLGYSIYDTIIIFDRIRENIPLMRRASVRVIGNVSLWEVLPRSLATTFITLLPVASLYVFGGDTLKDFAFALLVGIGSGAYSSIFVAAPLFAVLKQREPEFARRRDDLGALEGVSSVGGALAAEAAEVAAATSGDGDGGQPLDELEQPAPRVSAPTGPTTVQSASKRERRRQRRASRPHGRAR